MATPLSVIKAGGNVEFVDCNKFDLSMNLDDLKEKIMKYKPCSLGCAYRQPYSFYEEISRLCRENNIILLEDCAQRMAHLGILKKPVPGQRRAYTLLCD